jgi:hypothetical protein
LNNSGNIITGVSLEDSLRHFGISLSRGSSLLPARRSVFAFAVLVAFIGCGYAQIGFPTQVPRGIQDADIRNLVARYCRLDYLGARITEQDWQKLKPVVTWTSNPDFPLIDVVSRYDVDPEVTSQHGKWRVTVHYHLLGRFNMGEGYSTEISGSIKDADFTVSNINGELKVSSVDPDYPHPSRAAMLSWLQQKEAKADDPHSRIIYQQATTGLSAQSASPFAK